MDNNPSCSHQEAIKRTDTRALFLQNLLTFDYLLNIGLFPTRSIKIIALKEDQHEDKIWAS
jgi:hypothetical protein